jgi:hypothetical protein
MNFDVNALVVDGSGNLYAGGTFTTAGGAPASRVARWDGMGWHALDSGMDGNVNALAVDGSGNLYAGGLFATAGGAPASFVAGWNGTTWSALGSGMNNIGVFALAVDGSGNLYAGGLFTIAGETPASSIAKWNGTTWSALGSGMMSQSGGAGIVYSLAVDGSNEVYAGGGFTFAGSKPSYGFAIWHGDATTPTLLSLVSTEAGPDHVRLIWFTERDPGITATVYRRTIGSEWSARGEVSADGTGFIVFDDTQVLPGERYGYRIGMLQGGAEEFMGETWVDVPRVLSFALAGARPNPALNDLTVAFSLPDAAPAQLDLLDIAGRRVLTRDVGALGAGNHTLSFLRNTGLAPGVYLLRLTHGGRSLTARAVIIR